MAVPCLRAASSCQGCTGSTAAAQHACTAGAAAAVPPALGSVVCQAHSLVAARQALCWRWRAAKCTLCCAAQAAGEPSMDVPGIMQRAAASADRVTQGGPEAAVQPADRGAPVMPVPPGYSRGIPVCGQTSSSPQHSPGKPHHEGGASARAACRAPSRQATFRDLDQRAATGNRAAGDHAAGGAEHSTAPMLPARHPAGRPTNES